MCSANAAWACPHAGFPIRTSPAQAVAHTLPELLAVYHVLLRHNAPRHPPYALSSLSTCDAEILNFSRSPSYAIGKVLSRSSASGVYSPLRGRAHTSFALQHNDPTLRRAALALNRPLCVLLVLPMASCRQARCPLLGLLLVWFAQSSRLSHPLSIPNFMETRGLEPLTYALQRHRSPI